MPRSEIDDWNDGNLSALEKRISKVYGQAAKDVQSTIDDYFEKFKKRDAAKLKELADGKITDQQYKQWRLAQMGRGERFEDLRDKLAERMTKANEVAAAYINDATPWIYSLNRNYAAYTIEQVAGDVGFTMWDEQTIKRLIKEQPDLMPFYPPEKAVERGIDLKFGKRQITNQVTSGILQGESIPKIAKRLQKNIPEMNRKSAVRAARTAATGAENGGRMESYNLAEQMGIKIEKQWLSTLDGRTRDSHAALDKSHVPNDKEFSNGLMYPGDPGGPASEVYNCRCTMIAYYPEYPSTGASRRARDPKTGRSVLIEDITYEEWARWKENQQEIVFQSFDSAEKVNDFFYYDGEQRGHLARENSNFGKWDSGLTQDEKEAISWYTADGYGDINDYWRKRDGWESIPEDVVKDASRQIDSAISKFELKDNIVIQRGVEEFYGSSLIDQKEWNDIKETVGMTFRDLGYGSTTAIKGNSVATSKPVLFEIEVPSGKGRGAYVNKLAGQYEDIECEFLLARGSKFKITDVVINDEPIPSQTIIKMRMIVDD